MSSEKYFLSKPRSRVSKAYQHRFGNGNLPTLSNYHIFLYFSAYSILPAKDINKNVNLDDGYLAVIELNGGLTGIFKIDQLGRYQTILCSGKPDCIMYSANIKNFG